MNVLVRDPTLNQYLADSVNAGRVPSSASVNSDSWLTELLRLCECVLQRRGPCNVELLLDKVREVYPEDVQRDNKGVKKAEQIQQYWLSVVGACCSPASWLCSVSSSSTFCSGSAHCARCRCRMSLMN